MNSVSALDIELNKSLIAANGDKNVIKRDYVEITIPVPKIEHNSSPNNNNELQIISNNTTSVNRILVNGSKSTETPSSVITTTTTTSTKPHRFIATRRHRSLYVIPKQRLVIKENVLELETLNGGNSIPADTNITGSEKTIDTLSSETTDLQMNNETITTTKDNQSNQNDVS